MKQYLFDTNVVSAMRTMSRQTSAFRHWLTGIDLMTCFVSSLTWMEIQTGILKKRRVDPAQASVFERWLMDAREVFDHRTVMFDDAAAVATAPLWLLRSRGYVDTLIAGTALANGMDLVTRNVSDFADIPGLTVINPWE